MDTEQLTPEKRAELEQKHGDLLVLATEFGEAAFRAANPQEFQVYVDEQFNQETKGVALRHLVHTCRVWPEREVFDQMIKRRPGLWMAFGNELGEHCGMVRVEVRKK